MTQRSLGRPRGRITAEGIAWDRPVRINSASSSCATRCRQPDRRWLPRQFDPAVNRTIELIDVLWLDGNIITAAFEVESTTSIYSGLLRMSDLLAQQPNISIPLFLVAPEGRREKVIEQVNRPTFERMSQPLAEVCRYISSERLR